jgi:hypothetical protein
MASDEEPPEADRGWHVVYRCYTYGEISLSVEFTVLAPNAVMAVSRSAEPLHQLFTDAGRSRLDLRKVERI